MGKAISALLLRVLGGLRFPYLFALTALLFVADLLIPDVIPLVDELLLGLTTLVLGSLRKRRADRRLDEGKPAPDDEA